jgi:hypothetical protein
MRELLCARAARVRLLVRLFVCLLCLFVCCSLRTWQGIHLGYSDSAKDAGRLRAAFAIFEVQEKLVQVPCTPSHPPPLTHTHTDGSVSAFGCRQRSHCLASLHACMRACMRACVRACVRAGRGGKAR